MRRSFYLLIVLCLLAACSEAGSALPTMEALPTTEAQPAVDETQATQIVVENQSNVPGKLLFVRVENGSGDIWVHEGTEARRITTSHKKYQPSWSPDGSQIAYIQREESFADIWVMNANGSNKQQVTNNEPAGIPARSEDHVQSIRWAFYPRWSPDGQFLSYVSQAQTPRSVGGDSYQEYPLSLYIYGTRRIGTGDFPTASFQRFVQADTDLSHPTWSVDGSMIVYSQAERCFGCEVAEIQLGYAVLDLPGGNDEYGVLQGPSDDSFQGALDPAFSPDGKWLAFTKSVNGYSDIFIVPAPDATGKVSSAPIKLTSTGRSRQATWSPDGRKLAFFTINDQVTLSIADLSVQGNTPSLGQPVDIRRDLFDVDSGMAWAK
ncbi:TolB family protein [Herpetosiphon llansteffanensis]